MALNTFKTEVYNMKQTVVNFTSPFFPRYKSAMDMSEIFEFIVKFYKNRNFNILKMKLSYKLKKILNRFYILKSCLFCLTYQVNLSLSLYIAKIFNTKVIWLVANKYMQFL